MVFYGFQEFWPFPPCWLLVPRWQSGNGHLDDPDGSTQDPDGDARVFSRRAPLILTRVNTKAAGAHRLLAQKSPEQTLTHLTLARERVTLTLTLPPLPSY